ncbi:MAG TPA: Stk1 family PASTA domain-containing Ser/Thr kinase [Actinomycetota bacterium]|nr:Stk1 family PASTA domain-containing Ser/Thr kinase [Actinomycetota bacterium]
MTPGKVTFADRYTLLSKVGSGGMAEVYRARDDLLGREVAVKVLSERFSTDGSFIQRFRREAQSAANLSHPNIVSLYDFGSDKGTYYIVMELIEGHSLDELIKREGPLQPERAAEIVADVASALDRAHTANVVHRDIKPSNIMITKRGQIKVTDFGIARAMTSVDGEQTMTQAGMVIGTASYLSPEQAQGQPVDARSDVYSLGCVLFEALTAQPPFTGDTPLSIAYKHVREHPPAPSELNPDVPEGLDAITLKALAKNPDNRYTSAEEMREDLTRFLDGAEVHATPLLGATTQIAPVDEGTRVIRRTERDLDEPTRGGGWYILAALGILVLFAVLAWLFLSGALGGEEVEVPKLVGKTEDRARAALDDLNLDVEVVRAANEAPVDEVVDQDPKAGEMISEGDTVILTISSGPERVTVPDVVGFPLDEAKATLKREGLKAGPITREASEDVEEGEVIRQFPSADSEVTTGTKIELVVSSGPQLTVPSVIGLTQEEAEATLADSGLESTVITAVSDEEAGEVIAQDPDAGSPVEEGDVVTITVSEGPQEQPMPDVRGMEADEAQAILENEYGLVVTQTEGACAEPPGYVCDQDPPPDEPVAEGDSATLFVQPGDALIDPKGDPGGVGVAILFGGAGAIARMLRRRRP